jgi:predicted nucleotidyltransferase
MDVDRIERKMEEKKVYTKRVFHVREIGVFGSFIRGEQNASSDIDVLVDFERGHKDFFNYYLIKLSSKT